MFQIKSVNTIGEPIAPTVVGFLPQDVLKEITSTLEEMLKEKQVGTKIEITYWTDDKLGDWKE